MNNDPMNESVADRHHRLAAAFHLTVDAVPSGQMDHETPCEAWTISDVVEHVARTQIDFLGQRGLAAPSDPTPVAVSAAMQAALDDPTTAQATYQSYFGPTTIAETVDSFYCLDLVLHRWDIAVTAGLSDHIEDADIKRCRALLSPMGDNIRMPGIFGPEVEVPSDSAPVRRFIAWSGRDPAFCSR